MVAAHIILFSSVRVGEGIVGVVYLLEFLGAACALWRIGWYAIRMVSEGLSGGLSVPVGLLLVPVLRTFCKRLLSAVVLPLN